MKKIQLILRKFSKKELYQKTLTKKQKIHHKKLKIKKIKKMLKKLIMKLILKLIILKIKKTIILKKITR